MASAILTGVVSGRMRVNVSQSVSTAWLIQNCDLDWYHPAFDHILFPEPRQLSSTELEIVEPPYKAETGLEALKQLREQHVLSSLRELLLVTRCYPECLRKHDVVALGFRIKCVSRPGWRYAPYLFVRGQQRKLSLLWLGTKLKWNVRFLVTHL